MGLFYDRCVVEAHHDGQDWELIVEPDEIDQLLVVVTAYRVETKP